MASISPSRRGAVDGAATRPPWASICVLAAMLATPLTVAQAQTPPPAEQAPAAAPSKPCSVCGKVESVRQVKSSKPTSGVGAVAGGVVGGVIGHQIGSGRGRTVATVAGAAGGAYAGNTVEKKKNAKTAYEVSVRMQDGSMRTVQTTTAPPVGQAVTLKGDVLQPASSKKK
ncbi:Glycine zipper 2TM domain-containing protein [Variovorax sp. HW608]|uniref:glycine zipper 2TM domain-containing protein n=1 Tax=Variovorax sp. HW608 TaxID=1034889 RepID=UPI00081FCA36|nr:glycine zipper 2TM domain-containing protein [Variovorax sp. HW608]SCK58069.1 Glycine zipper 2TM domain-containing protein [Variovorax sp. HW608]